LEVPHEKHYLHDLRRRLAALDTPESVRNGNHSANGPIGSSVSAAAALKCVIEGLPDGDFTTNDLRERVKLSIGTTSKALRKLEREGLIERIPSPRPYRYRHLPRPRPDFTQAFMEAHGMMAAPDSSVSLRRLPLLANRALCGMTIEGIDLTGIVTDTASLYSGLPLHCPPPQALEPLTLAVLRGGGDFRAADRELGKAIREALATRRVLDRLPLGTSNRSALTDFCLPIEWLAFLEAHGEALVEAATQALGGELHPKEGDDEVAGRAIEETLGCLRAEGIAAQRDAEKGFLTGLDSADRDRVGLILRANIWEHAKKAELPVRKFYVKGMYRSAAGAVMRSGIGSPYGLSAARAEEIFLKTWGKSFFP
jgi:DNA-binding transcriptional ArsR family regulator